MMSMEDAERVAAAVKEWYAHFRSHDCRLNCEEGKRLWDAFEKEYATITWL